MTFAPSPYLSIISDVRDQTVRLLLEGELDYETTPDLEAAVDGLLASRSECRALYLDCGGLRFCDTIGLAGLLSIRRAADHAGMTLVLDNRTPALERLLEITGVLRHLTTPSTVDGSAGYGSPGTG